MLIPGKWEAGDDGVERPIVTVEVQAEDGIWIPAPFLIDTGADRSVISASILELLGALPRRAHEELQGVGGDFTSVLITTALRLLTESLQDLDFRGEFAALTNVTDLDISVLGRDVTDLFAVLVDRPGDLVCLLAAPSSYAITKGNG